MANREENLKKINAELEQLSDEELEAVAGGKMFYHPVKNKKKNTTSNNQVYGSNEMDTIIEPID